jgi:hypothetical protein
MRGIFFHALITVFFHAVFITFTGCKVSEKSPQSDQLEKIASQKLGANFTTTYNSLKTYALCQQARVGDHSDRIFRYVVIKLADNTIVREGSFRRGHVKWNDSKSLEILNGSRNRNEDSSQISIVNVEAGQL